MEAELHRAGKKRKLQGIQQRLAHAEASTTANSAVHALLMTLLAKGIMSGVLAHEFARAAQEDLRRAREGIVYPDLEKLANLAQGRNLLRSVFAQLRKSTSLPEPTKIPMPYTDGWQDTFILLPHEWFAAMAEDEYNWRRTICPNEDRLSDFWDSWENHPGMVRHPMKGISNWKTKFLPISLHGDEVPVMGVGKIWCRSVLAFTWMSMLANGLGSQMSDIVFYIWGIFSKFVAPASANTLGSMETLWRVLRWSFQSMFEGKWPTRDWRGLPYDKASKEGQRGGTPLARGFRAVLLQLCGDLDYLSTWLNVPASTNRSKPCAQCRATFHGINTWLDNRENSGWQRTLLSVSSWNSHWTSPCDIFQLPGMSCWSIAYDLMHNLYLGWLQHFYGSVFYLLTHECLLDTPLKNLQQVEAFIKNTQSQDGSRQRYRQKLSKLSMFVKKKVFPNLREELPMCVASILPCGYVGKISCMKIQCNIRQLKRSYD